MTKPTKNKTLIDRIKELFKPSEHSTVTEFILRNGDAYLNHNTREDIRVIEEDIDKNFEYYTGKYRASVEDMTFRQERLMETGTNTLRFYMPLILGSGVIDELTPENVPNTLTYVGALTVIQATTLLHRYSKFRGSVKIAKECKTELEEYISSHRDDLMNDDDEATKNVIEQIEGTRVNGGYGTEVYAQLQHVDSVIKANAAILAHNTKRLVRVEGVSRENRERLDEIESDPVIGRYRRSRAPTETEFPTGGI